MQHCLGAHGKCEKSNPGKNLTMFNEIFIFVQSEPLSFDLDPSSLVQSNKNNFRC